MKKVLCSAEKSSVIWAEPHSRSSAEQFGRTERSVYHYLWYVHLWYDTRGVHTRGVHIRGVHTRGVHTRGENTIGVHTIGLLKKVYIT